MIFYKRINFWYLLSLAIITLPGCFVTGAKKVESMDVKGIIFDDQTVPVIILGGGVAGLTSAVYFSQARVPCLMIEGPKPGGALTQSHSVRNWPGVLVAPGMDIVQSIKKQAEAGSARIVSEKVVGVDFSQWPRIVHTQSVEDPAVKKTYKACAVVVAMGTEPNFLKVPGESGPDGYWGRGIGNCAVCEGSLYKGKKIAIVGGGDAAITEADYLSDIASDLTIFVRKDAFRAKDVEAKDKVLAKPNVHVVFNTHVTQIHGDGKKLTHVSLKNDQTNQTSTFPIDGLFLGIGSNPNTSLFKGQLALTSRGFIALSHKQETSIRGIFAAGDVSDDEFVQAITASSDGCKATLQAIKFLKSIGFQTPKEVPAHTIAEQEKGQTKQVEVNNQEPVHKASAVIEVASSRDFERYVLKATSPVVFDLFATWCIPCKNMAPIFDKLAEEFKGKISFVKMNVANKALNVEALINQLGSKAVQSVPTFLLIKDGKEKERVSGVMSYELFKKKIETELTEKA